MIYYNMNYEEAKLYGLQLEELNDIHSKVLNSFEKGIMGITPDYVRETPEYKKAEKDFYKSFAELRNFNSWFLKTYKKEYMKERKNRYKQKTS